MFGSTTDRSPLRHPTSRKNGSVNPVSITYGYLAPGFDFFIYLNKIKIFLSLKNNDNNYNNNWVPMINSLFFFMVGIRYIIKPSLTTKENPIAMAYLAAKSLCTISLDSKYFIPEAI